MNWFLSTCCGLFRQCTDLSSFVSNIFWTVLKVCCFVSTVCEVVSTVCWFILAYAGLTRLRADLFRQCKVVSTYAGLPQNCTDLINLIYFGSSWHCPELSQHSLFYFHARIKSFSLFVYNSNKHQRKPKGQPRMDNPGTLETLGTQDTGWRKKKCLVVNLLFSGYSGLFPVIFVVVEMFLSSEFYTAPPFWYLPHTCIIRGTCLINETASPRVR